MPSLDYVPVLFFHASMTAWYRGTLVDYPYVLVRLRCDRCQRDGAYRLTRLVAKFGLHLELGNILNRLTTDCPYREDRRGKRRDEYCTAYFCDLEPPRRPPDLPEVRLRLVRGGKE